MKKIFFVFMIIFAFTIPAFADPADTTEDKYDYFYVGAGIGFTHFDGRTNPSSGWGGELYWHQYTFDGKDLAGKVFAGYRFHKFFALEASFHRFGAVKHNKLRSLEIAAGLPPIEIIDHQFKFQSYGSSLSILGYLRASKNIEVFTKVGLLYSVFKLKNHPFLIMGGLPFDKVDLFNDEGFSLLLGTGAEMTLSENLILRVEAECAFDIIQSNEAKLTRKLKRLNREFGDFTYNGFDTDVNLVSFTASLIWRF